MTILKFYNIKEKKSYDKLSDWKVYRKNPSVTTWIKKKDDYGLNPHLNGIIISVGINTDLELNKNGYGVQINNQGFIQSRRWFKTKSEAIKFAKEYMRKH